MFNVGTEPGERNESDFPDLRRDHSASPREQLRSTPHAQEHPVPIPDPDAFAEQKQLVEAAIQLHEADAPLTVEAICAEAGVEEEVFRGHFDDLAALLPAYYDLALDQYHLLTGATADYDDFTFEERLASFYYILLDTLGEQRAFVQATLDSRIRYASSFRADVRATLRALLTDDRIPQTNQLVTGLWPVQEVLTEVTFAIIRHWIGDDTEDQAATTALVDKLVAFVAELVTFRGVSTGVELAWHIVQHDALGLRRLPIVGWLLPGRGDPSTD